MSLMDLRVGFPRHRPGRFDQFAVAVLPPAKFLVGPSTGEGVGKHLAEQPEPLYQLVGPGAILAETTRSRSQIGPTRRSCSGIVNCDRRPARTQ